jgi:hypothetical protein
MLTGRCLCGAVVFSAEEAAPEFTACHCGMCRRWSGGSPLFTTHAKGVTFVSEEKLGRYESSDWAERGFCTVCGTPLYYRFKQSGAMMMSVGVFDEASAFRIKREIFVDRKPDGYALAGEHPRWTESETLARLK